MTAHIKSDALHASERVLDEELTEGELRRRQKISAHRKGRAQGGDGGINGMRVRVAKANAFHDQIRPVMEEIAKTISSHTGIAAELNRRGLRASRGGEWSAKQVERILCKRP